MNQMLLELMKLLTSIALSERTSEEMKKSASARLEQLMKIADEEIASAEEHIALGKQQMRESKFRV